MRPLPLLLPLLLLLLLLAAEPGAAPADAELRSRLRESLARKRASARLPRHAAHDFAALQEGAQTALGGRVAAVADSVAGAVDTFHRRAAAVHERVGATSVSVARVGAPSSCQLAFARPRAAPGRLRSKVRAPGKKPMVVRK